MGRTVISKEDVIKATEQMSGYSDFVPTGSPVVPMRSTEDIMWTIKFRSGNLKRFKFPIRTTSEGNANYDSSFSLEPDHYTSRLMKYIPAEVIALYMTFDSLIRSLEKTPMGIYWAIVIFCLVSTYLYLWRVQKVKKQTQLLISVIACFVWIFAIGGPFVHLHWYAPIYGGLLLPAYTLLIAIFEA